MSHQLINSEFTEGEQRWHYWLKLTFNEKQINKITITDHYQVNHKDVITNELILGILKKEVNGENLKPTKYRGKKKVYK